MHLLYALLTVSVAIVLWHVSANSYYVYIPGSLYDKSVGGVWYQGESVRHVWRGTAGFIHHCLHPLMIDDCVLIIAIR